MPQLILVAWLLVVGCVATAVRAADVHSPLAPAESLQHFHVEPGLAVELVACEPEVVDPIAIRFDEDGRMWVVEMRDYPHGPASGERPTSKIRILTDEDGDGRYETSRVFADELLFPTGLQPWKGGAIVTLAGQVVYMVDTDGDGRADSHEVWYRGFAQENPQLRANHPRLGLDGRVYVANGLRGGAVVDAREKDARPILISGMDFAFDPLTGQAEAVSGNGQFGMAFDDCGNRFVCNNREPLNHVVLENRYLARNPFLAVPAVVSHVAAGGEASRVYPLTDAWTTSNLHAGQFTAACGVEIYRGDALGPAYYGNAFTCEPTGSLVHREIVEPRGATFVSHRASETGEFLATPDGWFRPVNLETGPDGALYVVDMYRAVIEHPAFMPSELQQRADMRLGDDRGRIYRVVPTGAQAGVADRAKPQLSKASPAELVAALTRTNSWWRETAARLLIERKYDILLMRDEARSVRDLLAEAASKANEPAIRVTALCALEEAGMLDDEVLVAAIGDEHPRVREQAVALAEPRLLKAPAWRGRLSDLADDADARVRFRVALALGGLEGMAVNAPLASIALAIDDPWTAHAVATARTQHTGSVLDAVLDAPSAPGGEQQRLRVANELATIAGLGGLPTSVLKRVCREPDKLLPAAERVALKSWANARERRGETLADLVKKSTSVKRSEVVGDGGLGRCLETVFRLAAGAAHDPRRSEAERGEQIDLLRYSSVDVRQTLLKIVSNDPLPNLRSRAADALAPHADRADALALVETLGRQSPAVRRSIIEALTVRPAAAAVLLDAIADGRIARSKSARRANRLCSSIAMPRFAAGPKTSSNPACRQIARPCWPTTARRSI